MREQEAVRETFTAQHIQCLHLFNYNPTSDHCQKITTVVTYLGMILQAVIWKYYFLTTTFEFTCSVIYFQAIFN